MAHEQVACSVISIPLQEVLPEPLRVRKQDLTHLRPVVAESVVIITQYSAVQRVLLQVETAELLPEILQRKDVLQVLHVRVYVRVETLEVHPEQYSVERLQEDLPEPSALVVTAREVHLPELPTAGRVVMTCSHPISYLSLIRDR